jgi:hypothetical protein
MAVLAKRVLVPPPQHARELLRASEVLRVGPEGGSPNHAFDEHGACSDDPFVARSN